MDYNIVDTMRI